MQQHNISSASNLKSNQLKNKPTPLRHSQRPTLRNLNPVFHKRQKSEDNACVTDALLKLARRVGTLNLSGKGLNQVPDRVYALNKTDETVAVTLENLSANEEDAWWNQIPINNLDLSSNQLYEISPKVADLNSLTVLLLHDNALTSIPKEIAQLDKLIRLNLSHNNLKELPLELFTLPKLCNLNLSYNQIEELHTDISNLHMLEVLDVSNNQLRSLPNGIGFLVRVTTLSLAFNQINELPPDIIDMRSLQKLDLMQNNLNALPEIMGSLRKLQFLYVQHNDIKLLPDFEGCENLQELYIGNNYIEEIPNEFCSNLPHLKILDLHENNIEEIPDNIALLQNLIRLDISNNSIAQLPNSLSTLPHLTSLQLEGNPIKTIGRHILQSGTVRILKTLRERAEADLNNSMLVGDGLNSPRHAEHEKENSIFPDKYKIRKSHCLTVTMQQLNEVPRKVFETARSECAHIVDFSRNRLKTLPEGLVELKDTACELTFSNNLIDTIPDFLSQFTRVTLINLACNNIAQLPNSFAELKTLRELNISNNRFESIPESLYKLQNLEILLARDNQIKYINASDSGLGALKRLATLDLRNNDIEQVPPILGNLQNITSLEIIGNPFKLPRHQTLERGTEAIMSYLRDRIPA